METEVLSFSIDALRKKRSAHPTRATQNKDFILDSGNDIE